MTENQNMNLSISHTIKSWGSHMPMYQLVMRHIVIKYHGFGTTREEGGSLRHAIHISMEMILGALML